MNVSVRLLLFIFVAALLPTTAQTETNAPATPLPHTQAFGSVQIVATAAHPSLVVTTTTNPCTQVPVSQTGTVAEWLSQTPCANIDLALAPLEGVQDHITVVRQANRFTTITVLQTAEATLKPFVAQGRIPATAHEPTILPSAVVFSTVSSKVAFSSYAIVDNPKPSTGMAQVPHYVLLC